VCYGHIVAPLAIEEFPQLDSEGTGVQEGEKELKYSDQVPKNSGNLGEWDIWRIFLDSESF
jgi:hypothetical protein